MKYFTFYLFSIMVITSCINLTNPPACLTTYHFDIPLSISPQIDTFKIGDTLWLESTIPNNLKDKNSDKIINIQGFDFSTRINVARFDTTAIVYADFLFEHINQIGALQITSNTNTNVIYEQGLENKELKVGLIPSEVGGFYISFYNFTDDLHDVSLTDTSCIQMVELSYYMNDGNMNLHFITESSNVDNVTTEEEALKNGIYAFWIIE